MKFTKCFVVSGLILLMGACDFWKGTLDINIGDYENQLATWNSQNLIDYQIEVNSRTAFGRKENALITVKNGVLESCDPEDWTDYNSSTVPEFYSLIKEVEKDYRDGHKKSNDRYSLKVSYNTDYHYPCEIVYTHSSERSGGKGAWSRMTWTITLTPPEEEEQEDGSSEK